MKDDARALGSATCLAAQHTNQTHKSGTTATTHNSGPSNAAGKASASSQSSGQTAPSLPSRQRRTAKAPSPTPRRKVQKDNLTTAGSSCQTARKVKEKSLSLQKNAKQPIDDSTSSSVSHSSGIINNKANSKKVLDPPKGSFWSPAARNAMLFSVFSKGANASEDDNYATVLRGSSGSDRRQSRVRPGDFALPRHLSTGTLPQRSELADAPQKKVKKSGKTGFSLAPTTIASRGLTVVASPPAPGRAMAASASGAHCQDGNTVPSPSHPSGLFQDSSCHDKVKTPPPPSPQPLPTPPQPAIPKPFPRLGKALVSSNVRRPKRPQTSCTSTSNLAKTKKKTKVTADSCAEEQQFVANSSSPETAKTRTQTNEGANKKRSVASDAAPAREALAPGLLSSKASESKERRNEQNTQATTSRRQTRQDVSRSDTATTTRVTKTFGPTRSIKDFFSPSPLLPSAPMEVVSSSSPPVSSSTPLGSLSEGFADSTTVESNPFGLSQPAHTSFVPCSRTGNNDTEEGSKTGCFFQNEANSDLRSKKAGSWSSSTQDDNSVADNHDHGTSFLVCPWCRINLFCAFTTGSVCCQVCLGCPGPGSNAARCGSCGFFVSSCCFARLAGGYRPRTLY